MLLLRRGRRRLQLVLLRRRCLLVRLPQGCWTHSMSALTCIQDVPCVLDTLGVSIRVCPTHSPSALAAAEEAGEAAAAGAASEALLAGTPDKRGGVSYARGTPVRTSCRCRTHARECWTHYCACWTHCHACWTHSMSAFACIQHTLRQHILGSKTSGCVYGFGGPACWYAWYRGTSLMRNNPFLGPYSRLMPRALWWS